MNKLRLFLSNFLVYGLGGIISKLIPLIMVPIVTRLMPGTEYYGLSDLSNTVVQFASALAVMGMYDAMYRLFFDKEDEHYKKSICSTTLIFTIVTSLIVFVLMMSMKDFLARWFLGNSKYAYIICLSAMATLVGATNTIIAAPTRMQNKRCIYLVANTVGPLISYLITIPMLLKGYYTIALPLAAVISGVIMEISFGVMNRKWFSMKRFDFKILKQLLIIAIPLLPNFLIYWIFNSCDKVMVTNIIGTSAAGIYSVASKLGHCSQLIYTAFAGGWQFFAFSTMKEENQVTSNSRIFEYLGIISFITTAFICASSFWIFKVLFTNDYLQGYLAAPFLFLAPLLQMLFQVACNQFLVIKKTWPNMLILLIGAVLNIILNLVLIPQMGIEGASIATLSGYIASDIICVAVLMKMKLMVISKRFIISSIIIAAYIILWRTMFSSLFIIGMIFACVITTVFIILYRAELELIISMIKKRGND